MLEIESAALTDVGQKRKGNEDSHLVDEAAGLYVVADGMGGHKAGEVASRLLVETLGDYFKDAGADPRFEALAEADPPRSQLANRLLAGILKANAVIFEAAQQNAAYRGMGSTVSAVCVTDTHLIVANVGDSPIYLVRDGQVTLQSTLHTYMAEMEALSTETARKLDERFHHMLTRAMGTKPEVTPDVKELPHQAGDTVVISSDGLTDKVRAEEIAKVVSSVPPAKACRLLVDLANKRGGDDNITVVVLAIAPAAAERVVGFDTEDHSYQGPIRHLDAAQVVIETSEPIGEEEDVMVSFTLPTGALTVTGEVTERSAGTITVRFLPPLTEKQQAALAPLFD